MIVQGPKAIAALAIAALGIACTSDGGSVHADDLERLVGDGSPVVCSTTAYDVRAFEASTCWGFNAEVGDIYYFGGTHFKDRGQGVIVIHGDDADHDPWWETPDREGETTIYYASLETICFTTAEFGSPEPHAMHVSASDPTKRRFLSPAEARERCPSPGTVSVEESGPLPGEYRRQVDPDDPSDDPDAR